MQAEVRYLPLHRREECIIENVTKEKPNAVRATTPQRIFAQTNLITQPEAYEGGFSFSGFLGGIMQPHAGVNGN